MTITGNSVRLHLARGRRDFETKLKIFLLEAVFWVKHELERILCHV
jgi:hypothetical protein